MPWWAGGWLICPRAPGWAPARCGERRSCVSCAPICGSSPCAEILSPDVVCPAVGQGALAIETSRTGLLACQPLNHLPTESAVTAERALLAALGGGCQVPIGAYATVSGDRLSLQAVVVSPDGVDLVCDRSEGSAADAQRIGRELGEALLAAGADRILESVYG
jgi:hydroxymethylbilane synthase